MPLGWLWWIGSIGGPSELSWPLLHLDMDRRQVRSVLSELRGDEVNIPCEVSNGFSTLVLVSIWEFNPDEPWTFNLSFVDQEAEWVISLGLIEEAITDPNGDIHGYADVRVTALEGFLTIRLDNGQTACLLDFPISDVEEFLNEIDTSNAQMVIGQKLDEFLNAL